MNLGALSEELRPWAAELLRSSWGGTDVISRGRVHHADRLPGFVVFEGNAPVGLATYAVDGRECELVTLNSEARGGGTMLLEAVVARARSMGCGRVWLVTTNDNVDALRFYQRRGLRLAALHRDAVDASRRLKPSIPRVGAHGIPVHDEIEVEVRLI